MPESDLGSDSPLSPSLPTPPASAGTFSIGQVVRPASDLISITAELDCAYIGNRVTLSHPGRDRLAVEIEPISAVIAAGILKIKTAAGSGSTNPVAPNSAVDITSTSSTQKQSGLDITGQTESRVEVSTAQAGLIVKVRMTAMKS